MLDTLLVQCWFSFPYVPLVGLWKCLSMGSHQQRHFHANILSNLLSSATVFMQSCHASNETVCIKYLILAFSRAENYHVVFADSRI